MSEYVHLVGADDVKSAGFAMQRAADDMKCAASSIEDSLCRHCQKMDAWLERFAALIAERERAAK